MRICFNDLNEDLVRGGVEKIHRCQKNHSSSYEKFLSFKKSHRNDFNKKNNSRKYA